MRFVGTDCLEQYEGRVSIKRVVEGLEFSSHWRIMSQVYRAFKIPQWHRALKFALSGSR